MFLQANNHHEDPLLNNPIDAVALTSAGSNVFEDQDEKVQLLLQQDIKQYPFPVKHCTHSIEQCIQSSCLQLMYFVSRFERAISRKVDSIS